MVSRRYFRNTTTSLPYGLETDETEFWDVIKDDENADLSQRNKVGFSGTEVDGRLRGRPRRRESKNLRVTKLPEARLVGRRG